MHPVRITINHYHIVILVTFLTFFGCFIIIVITIVYISVFFYLF